MPDEPTHIHDWPDWRGTPLDIVMYAGYLYGRDILLTAPWIAHSNSIRLGAGTQLSLTISEVNGLVLSRDPDSIVYPHRDEREEKIVESITDLIERKATMSWNNLETEHLFLRRAERTIWELHHFSNTQPNTPNQEK